MSQMRFNVITRDWVIMAEDRARKPNDFASERAVRDQVERRDDCPFCVGNEGMTPGELCRVEGRDGGWRVRVVPNKYAALRPGGDEERVSRGTFHAMCASGEHEVVIEHPRHDMTLATMEAEDVEAGIRVYRDRYAALREMPHIESIIVFRNHGERAGTSLEHPHSQIVAAPIVPPQIRMRIEEASRYYDETGDCVFCRVLADELEAGERVVEETAHFAAFVPYAALSPFHLWIFPRRHESSFDRISEEEIDDLAGLLGRMARRMVDALGDPDFNLGIRAGPTSETSAKYYHWYVTVIPRVNRAAGFEMGSGKSRFRSTPCAL
jgi:UDPglucose--hexose-1-phosphate uridylyltransferase